MAGSIISRLAYAWNVEADDPRDAVYEAVSRATGLYNNIVLRQRLELKPVDAGLYVLEDRETGERIVVRVTEQRNSYDMVWAVMGRAPSPRRRYTVTFYPKTYGRI